MTEIAATGKRGRRARVEVVERVAFVRRSWSAHDGDRAKVHVDFVDFYGPTPERTIDSYIRRVHDGYIRSAEESALSERDAFLAKVEADLALYANAKAWGPHASARKLQARVLGLDVQQVDVRGGLTLTAAHVSTEEIPLTEHEMELASTVIESERARLAPRAPESTPTEEK